MGLFYFERKHYDIDMKKLIFILFLGILLANPAFAQTAKPESVPNFVQTIHVNPDATLTVNEMISYDFGTTEHHGIYRDIPYKYQRNGMNYNLRISNVSVAGQQFTTTQRNGNYEIKIGDPNTYVTGLVNYNLTYTVTGAINFFSDHDELYWNVVGSGWTAPIMNAAADIILPGNVSQDKINIDCFAGQTGTNESCVSKQTSPGKASFRQTAMVSTDSFTVVVGWPKGVVAQPSSWQVLAHTIEDNLIFLLPLVVFGIMFFVWWEFGRDPKSKLPIVAQYEAPDGLIPAETRYLATEQTGNLSVSSEIIYLATLGYLSIERIPGQSWLKPEDFKFTKLKNGDDLNNPFDKKVLDVLFGGADTVLLSEIKKRKARDPFNSGSIAQKLTVDGYFDKNPTRVRLEYFVAVGIAGFVMIYLLGKFWQPSYILSFILNGLIVLGFAWFMPRKTQKGADVKQLILGLKEYLSVAEKDRLDFHNDPEKDPKLFEKLLPYAMALGVSEQWSKKFEGLADYHPSWYSDPTQAYFNVVVFNAALNHFNSNFSSALAASARSAGGGESGFGGGGFSGGGFGGGGGGSW